MALAGTDTLAGVLSVPVLPRPLPGSDRYQRSEGAEAPFYSIAYE